ncbi:MAG: hypothetical protein KDB07_05235 [Planctomycetes bacterium]|nr:hypothetical protein [Planctomycetota bacterium]
MSSILNYARLMRVSNLPTCIADVAAGYFIAVGPVALNLLGTGQSGRDAEWPALVLMAIASMLIYSGGMVDNDVKHVDKDHVLKSKRPIPMGLISLGRASWLSGWLFLAGVIAASFAPLLGASDNVARYWAIPIGIALVLLCKVYNVLSAGRTIEYTHFPASVGKQAAGVVTLALCRVANLGLGFLIGARLEGGIELQGAWIPFVFMFAYFVLVIVASLFEDSGAKKRIAMLLLALTLVLGLLALPLLAASVGRAEASDFFIVSNWGWSEALYCALLTLTTAIVSYRCVVAYRSPSPRNMGMIVKWGIASDCLVMGALVAVSGPNHAFAGLAVAALFVACYLLGRSIAST